MNSIELFAGCGGLALGISQAGFKHQLIVEKDVRALETLEWNRDAKVEHIRDWPLFEGDVRDVDYSKLVSQIDLVAGGPPCQPFSIGGKHKGPNDARNMWPEAIRCVREVKPRAFIFENVRGLLRPTFSEYLEFIKLQLSWPEIIQGRNESVEKYLNRLKIHEGKGNRPSYHVSVNDINMADFGAPQKRHRAIIMGIRTDVSEIKIYPEITHSRGALLWDQYVTGEYWERHEISKRRRAPVPVSAIGTLERLIASETRPEEKPWVTVRDTISDLPKPRADREPILNHRLHPGARAYVGHTGSLWDEPAKALKAGAHGVPGGENMIVMPDGSVRYFTIREMARLQGFPDDYYISGAWANCIRQMGNAVPVQASRCLGEEVHAILKSSVSTKRKVASAR